MATQTRYAMGFLLSPDGRYVVLVRKNRPAILVGKLTGVGGHQEPGETSLECLVREIEEETGVVTSQDEWTHFATVETPEMYFPCYYLRSAKFALAYSVTEERIEILEAHLLDPEQLAPLALDLIRLALAHTGGAAMDFEPSVFVEELRERVESTKDK